MQEISNRTPHSVAKAISRPPRALPSRGCTGTFLATQRRPCSVGFQDSPRVPGEGDRQDRNQSQQDEAGGKNRYCLLGGDIHMKVYDLGLTARYTHM
jgi:hypothetical protein